MKCMYNQSKRGLPSDVRTLALRVAKEMRGACLPDRAGPPPGIKRLWGGTEFY